MNVEHAWSKYVIHHDHWDYLQSFLSDLGIETKKNYSTPLHLHSLAFAFDMEYYTGVLEGAEQFSKTCLSLPIYPELTDSEVEAVVSAVKECIS